MSKTIVDMPKVSQAMDAGWNFEMFKSQLGFYTVICRHANPILMDRRREFVDDDGDIVTDDFTPEQALTRAAYKCVDGIILETEHKDDDQ